MTRIISISDSSVLQFKRCLVLLIILLSGMVYAADAFVPIPPLKQRVTDLTGTLSSAQINNLEQMLRVFEQKKGSQIAVLILPTTKPEEIEQYSIRLAEQWKIGRKKGIDDGVILVVAKNDRSMRLEVGYGLEGVIPDAIAKRIIIEVMAPYFRANDFYTGISTGLTQVMKLIEGEPLPPPSGSNRSTSADSYENLFIFALIFAVFVGSMLTRMLGRFFGAGITGFVAGMIVWFIAGMVAAIIATLVVFILALLSGGGSRHWSGRGWGGTWGSGGFGGGGGGFGGGGASGRW